MSDNSSRLERVRNSFVFFGFGLSGAAALIYEVVWTRSLSTVMGSSTYAVSTMLAAFMAGLSVGGALGAWLSPKIRRPYLAFAWCEFGIGSTGLITIPVIMAATPLYIKSFYAFHLSFKAFSIVQFAIIFAIMAAPTTLMGLTFPVIMKMFAGNGRDVGTQVGRLYCVNTLGAIVGSTAAGFFLIPAFGIKGTAIVAASTNILVAIITLILSASLKQSTAALVLFLGMMPLSRRLNVEKLPFFSYYNAFRFSTNEMADIVYQSVNKPDESRVLYSHEGNDGNVSLIRYKVPGHSGEGSTGTVLINGSKREAGDDLGFALLAYLPYFSHGGGPPTTALNIGLGSGRTLSHLSGFQIGRIDSVELSEGILDVNRKILSPELFADRRINHLQADGRNYLLVADQQYDIIIASPSWAVEQSSAGMLTDEFFTLAKSRLAQNGTIAVWIDFFLMSRSDLDVIARTFRKSFTHAMAWYVDGDFVILTGSNVPFRHMPEEYMKAVNFYNPDLLGKWDIALSEEMVAKIPPGPLNTDDKPIIEFSNARNLITWQAQGS
jgi:spermidine synthase